MQPELLVRLPTEAEWEYACRAGTATSTYAGDLRSGLWNDPVLDAIAWYAGNSITEFDLAITLGDQTSKQRAAGTHGVKAKLPNSWGLHDMLGNVWELCSDWYGVLGVQAESDPTGPRGGSAIVVRGGSWENGAQLVRAASRDGSEPEGKSSSLGFRIARGPGMQTR